MKTRQVKVVPNCRTTLQEGSFLHRRSFSNVRVLTLAQSGPSYSSVLPSEFMYVMNSVSIQPENKLNLT